MAERVIDLSDPDTVLHWVRGTVASFIGLAVIGDAAVAAKRVSPAAHLNRLGLTAPDYDALQRGIALLWGVEVIVPTNARVQEVADAILAAYTRSLSMDDALAFPTDIEDELAGLVAGLGPSHLTADAVRPASCIAALIAPIGTLVDLEIAIRDTWKVHVSLGPTATIAATADRIRAQLNRRIAA